MVDFVHLLRRRLSFDDVKLSGVLQPHSLHPVTGEHGSDKLRKYGRDA